jgi:hypothetical protein
VRIEINRPAPGETFRPPTVVIEAGDRVALLNLAHQVVGEPKTIPASGVVQWDEIGECDRYWWAPLDEGGNPIALFDGDEWTHGMTYTLVNRRGETP